MLDVKRLVSKAKQAQTRVSRSGLPQGFFFNDLMWFGDGAAVYTSVARGFVIEPAEMDSLDEQSKENLSHRLRILLATLGEDYTLQIRYLVCSDYELELEAYRAATEAITDKHKYRWQVWNRTERYNRYKEAMQKGQLRREILTVFFTHVVETKPRFSLSEEAMKRHFQAIAEREAKAFDAIQGDALRTIFPDCRVRTMGTREHFFHYYRFLNPNVGASVPENVLEGFDETLSIEENCLFSDIVQPNTPGVSFDLDGYHHAVLVMRELPKSIGAGLITRLTDIGFVDFEISVNLYPQNPAKVIKEFEKIANQLEGEVNTQPKEKYHLKVQHEMADQMIKQMEQGAVYPFNMFLTLRLWHKDPEEIISRTAIVRNAFLSMYGSTCHHATNAETARQLWFQSFPGWTYGLYRGFDIPCDDATAAELIPWSASFTGRLSIAEALYDSPKNSLVGVSTQVGRVPQHMLWFGITGSGKSVLFSDFFAQIGHLFGYTLIVEEGLSHGTTVQTVGGDPIILTPDSNVTINPFDCCGAPLSNSLLGGAVSLCLQMLRENVGNVDHGRVNVYQGILTKHIELLYNSAWKEWSLQHAEKAHDIARRALGIYRHLTTMSGHGNTFLDSWAECRDWECNDPETFKAYLETISDGDISLFATHHYTRDTVRNLGFSYMRPEDMPRLGQLVELMSLTPIGGHEENPVAVGLGDRLRAWQANGNYGKLFDGVMTNRLDSDITHFELGFIDPSMEDLRAAAHFLVLNVARQQVMKRPRSERKLLFFEEGARLLQMPGGAAVLKEFYAQARKFGAVVGTVFQQYAALKCSDETIRASVFDNTKLFLVSAQPSPQATDDIGKALEISEAAREAIKRYPSPEHQTGNRFSSFMMVAPDPQRKMVGTLRNIATKEVVFCGASDNKVFDNRNKALMQYDDIVEGIIEESRK